LSHPTFILRTPCILKENEGDEVERRSKAKELRKDQKEGYWEGT